MRVLGWMVAAVLLAVSCSSSADDDDGQPPEARALVEVTVGGEVLCVEALPDAEILVFEIPSDGCEGGDFERGTVAELFRWQPVPTDTEAASVADLSTGVSLLLLVGLSPDSIVTVGATTLTTIQLGETSSYVAVDDALWGTARSCVDSDCSLDIGLTTPTNAGERVARMRWTEGPGEQGGIVGFEPFEPSP